MNQLNITNDIFDGEYPDTAGTGITTYNVKSYLIVQNNSCIINGDTLHAFTGSLIDQG